MPTASSASPQANFRRTACGDKAAASYNFLSEGKLRHDTEMLALLCLLDGFDQFVTYHNDVVLFANHFFGLKIIANPAK
jgi:hypothetical protein